LIVISLHQKIEASKIYLFFATNWWFNDFFHPLSPNREKKGKTVFSAPDFLLDLRSEGEYKGRPVSQLFPVSPSGHPWVSRLRWS